ncbi:hypothetical protein [Portibacter marinus]|uniref:hypothetical protein n=1 Tax=Portibacter marinus TaxID=2898660 RepID=UPI001F3E36F7|nr:hypothetical protein [Portibacter marinus]
MKSIYLLYFCFLCTPLISQQASSDLTQDSFRIIRNFTFNNEDFKQEIKISLSNHTLPKQFRFYGEIEFGNVEMQILDPLGKYEGGFSLKKDMSDNRGKKAVTGHFEKDIIRPIEGDWIISISAVKTKGKVKLEVLEIAKEEMDDH